MTSEDPIAAIRARHARATAPHTCTRIRVKQSELVANVEAMFTTCSIVVTDEEGKERGIISRSCTPLYDDDWTEDVGILLAEVDRQKALADAAVKFRIGTVDVFLIPKREIEDVGEERWSAFDGVNAKGFPERDDAIAHARRFNSATRTYEEPEEG